MKFYFILFLSLKLYVFYIFLELSISKDIEAKFPTTIQLP